MGESRKGSGREPRLMRKASALLRGIRGLYVASIAAMCALTFVWPSVVSADPAHPGFKVAAIATFVVFFVSLAVVLAARLREQR